MSFASITAAHGTWVVPQVSCASGETSDSNEWVGLGGTHQSWFEELMAKYAHVTSFETLYQAGVDATCSYGTAVYAPFEQFYNESHPNGGTPLPVKDKVLPGDAMAVTVTDNPPKADTTWSMSDMRGGHEVWHDSGSWSNKIKADYTGECIVEDPQLKGGEAPLTDFGSVTFPNCQASMGSSGYNFTAPLPRNWRAVLFSMIGSGNRTLAIPSLNPLMVTYRSNPSCTASSIMEAVDAYTASHGFPPHESAGQPTCADGWASLPTSEVENGQVLGPDEAIASMSDGRWNVVLLSEGYPCSDLPAAAVQALGTAADCISESTTIAPPTSTTSPSSGLPSGPGFEAAKQQWISSVNVAGGADQNLPILQAITDLQNGMATDQNTSGYTASIAVLQDMTTLPDAMATPAQVAQAANDEAQLDTFFGTPNLYAN